MSSNMSPNMSCMREILTLAKILRKDGDQVLNGSSKLSLSTELLHNLNDAFALIIEESKDFESSFQVCSSSEIDLFRDLKFLHDFVQKILWLKIVQTNNDSRILVDLTKFRHLRYLELQKVRIDLVNGIQGVRGQLETISCTGGGGVGTIGRLLATCGGDDGVGFVWASLKHLSLSYNGLGRLDKSLELAPWLQTLDLSHNLISIATELDCIPSLKFVNLGYNKLEKIPVFNKLTYRSLQVLVLKHNYIENIDGLQGLDFLAELDLSFNCLADHSFLWPLEVMTALLWLNLTGNPLSHHIRHRALTSKYLHASLAENKFILDHYPLSKSEKLIVVENRSFNMRPFLSSYESSSNSLIGVITHSSTESSVDSARTTRMSPPQPEIDSSAGMSGSKIRRRANVKEVRIENDSEWDDDSITDNALEKLKDSNSAASMDHLETKKKILALRNKYGGENWLSSHAGFFVQDIMGIDRSSGSIVAPTSTMETAPIAQSYSLTKMSNTRDDGSSVKSDSILSYEPDVSDVADHREQSMADTNSTIVNEEAMDKKEITDSDYCDDHEEEQGELFLVKRIQNSETSEMEQIFLIITPTNIKEHDPITGKMRCRWSIDGILSCKIGREESATIELIFDTTRRDRQYRTYFAESSNDASKVVEVVGDLMMKRPLLLKVFECMKCSTHFSQDSDSVLINSMTIAEPKPPICPSCRSTLVIQTDDISAISSGGDDSKLDSSSKSDSMIDHRVIVNLQHSTSQSSIGGKENGAKSIATSITYSDSLHQAQVHCTATSLDDSRESTPSINTLVKKCESDIEILSNPSQSSIEVLDDGSKSNTTPLWKRSTGECRIAVTPTLLIMSDITLRATGLTESSSSGSLTDSICTTYENEKVRRSPITTLRSQKYVPMEHDQNKCVGRIGDSSYASVGNLTSMLGGLLQSMKIGGQKESPVKVERDPDLFSTDIRYSYTNFTSVDHRIKLYLILNIFDLENEELVFFLRCDILMSDYVTPFPGCLVLSTSKIYVLRVIGPEGEDPQRWLHKETSWTKDCLRTFTSLPFKQGVLMVIEQSNKFSEDHTNIVLICILQDFQRTSNVLFHLTDSPLAMKCDVASPIPEKCTVEIHNLMFSSKHYRDGDAIRIFALFSSVSLQSERHEAKFQIGGLLVTTSSVILIDDKIHWLLSPDEAPSKFAEQPISNLIGVGLDGFSLALKFFDEIRGVEEVWILTFISANAANAVIDAIQLPWEELFSVPLQIIKKCP